MPSQLTIPGDKSVTHRALILGALAEGRTVVRGAQVAEDTRSTAAILRSLGVDVPELSTTEFAFDGVGLRGLLQPADPLDCGNSGTTARLMTGVLAGQPLRATLTGDASLRSRPMARVTDPLRAMGGQFTYLGEEDRLPLRVDGRDLGPLDLTLPVASAQVKSALLLAALVSESFVLIGEPRRSRDHTERMLSAMGAAVVGHWAGSGWRVELRDPPARLRAGTVRVPGDFSTAAFFIVYGLLRGGSEPLILGGVGLNPTRTGLLPVLERMGARIEVLPETHENGGEPVGTLVVHPSRLTATQIEAPEVPGMIDEIPAWAVAALRAEGTSRVEGAGELRVKESDRIGAIVDNVRAIGGVAEEFADGFELQGTSAPLAGAVAASHDHRIAMAFGVLQGVTGGAVMIDDPEVAAVSFPEFWTTLARVQSESEGRRGPGTPRPDADGAGPTTRREPVVTIDGPAGSGKSSTARAVAAKLGFRHLDSGALYRALTRALLDEGEDPETWSSLTYHDLRALGVEAVPTEQGLRIRTRGRPVPDGELRTPEVTRAVSGVAALPAVRRALLDLQRQAAAHGGVVADGRDMGTVVFPDAEVKVFLVADLEERARRRLLEERGSQAQGGTASGPDTTAAATDQIQEFAHALQARDFADTHREHAPLRRAADAVVLDTTDLAFHDQVDRVVALVERARATR